MHLHFRFAVFFTIPKALLKGSLTVLKVSVVLLREVSAFIESIVESNDWTMTGANTSGCLKEVFVKGELTVSQDILK